MKIIPVYHQPIRLLVQIINARHQTAFEILGEMLGIDQQVLILAQKRH